MRRPVIMPAAYAATALGLVMVVGAALAQTRTDKPRVPAGVDPGGVAVAVIGSGIDYTRPGIAARLARDGEGEIIGWDFLDNDRRPFDPTYCRAGDPHCNNGLLGRFTDQHSRSRLIIMRAAIDRPQTLVQAVQAAAQTPARIVLVAVGPVPESFLVEASQRFPQLFFVGAVAPAAQAAADKPPTEVNLRNGYLAVPYGLQSRQKIAIDASRVAAAFAHLAAGCRAADRSISACIRSDAASHPELRDVAIQP